MKGGAVDGPEIAWGTVPGDLRGRRGGVKIAREDPGV